MKRLLTDGSGTVTATKKYDVFGSVRATTGSASTEYLFTGQQEDATLGYTYLRARYYDQGTGRFISKDRFPSKTTDSQAVNRYSYVENNPIHLTDLTGQSAGGDPAMEACINSPSECFGGGGNPVGPGKPPGGGGAGGGGSKGGRAPNEKGRAGEERAGIDKNTTRVDSETGTAKYRVPDYLDDKRIGEIKNRERYSLTGQLRDYEAIAEREGKTFEFGVPEGTNPSTDFSGPLQRAIEEGDIELWHYQ